MASKIDPWGSGEVRIDEKLMKEFGLKRFDSKGLGSKHRFLSRNIIVAQRDFEVVKEHIIKKKPFIQMTGIASSGPLHLGHKVDIDAYLLMRELGARSRFGICDIDGYVSRPDSKVGSMSDAKRFSVEMVAHVMALGIPEEEIYVQSQKEPRYYEFAFELSKKITENSFRAIYGHVNPGKLSANLLQYADILHLQLKEYFGPMPSITGIGIEQDPHARACRDMAKRLPYGLKMPSFFYFMHQGGLQQGSKMSASEPDTAIFLDDDAKEVKRKINKAFSGGQDSVEKHRKLGGNPDIDKAYEILFYHHPDDKLVKDVYEKYKSGEMLTGELKKTCIDFLTSFLEEHQTKVKKNMPRAKKIVYG